MQKLGPMKALVLVVVVVLANIYMGCIQSYPKERLSAEDQIRLKQLEENQRSLLQQQSEQNRKIIEEMRKEIEELKKKQSSPKD